MSNITDTIVLDLPKSAPYYDALMDLLEQARNDACLHVIADCDITECEMQMGDVYTIGGQKTQVINTSYIMAEQRHSAAMIMLDSDGNITSIFNMYVSEVLEDSNWQFVSRWGDCEPKSKLRLL